MMGNKHDVMCREDLNALLKALELTDPDNSIDKALEYFRSKYRERRNKYPGNKELYKMFSEGVLPKLSQLMNQC